MRIVYSPLDALKLAVDNPEREVVFFAVGFETTAPANAMAVYQAAQKDVHNFSLLVSHVLVPPAMEAILSFPEHRVQGFLAAGHVCAVMGYWEYEPIAAKYRVPIVVTGFEPVDILQGIYMCIRQLEEGRAEVENQYARSVRQRRQSARAKADPRGIPRGAAQVARNRGNPPKRSGAAGKVRARLTPKRGSALPITLPTNRRNASAD